MWDAAETVVARNRLLRVWPGQSGAEGCKTALVAAVVDYLNQGSVSLELEEVELQEVQIQYASAEELLETVDEPVVLVPLARGTTVGLQRTSH